jgi:hypothetical protein
MHSLLDDVLSTTGAGSSPDRAAILKMVRQERSRRHRAYATFAAVVMASIVMLILWQPVSRETVSAVTSPPAPRPIVIHEVDDQQFLALLNGTPAALMEWPDGQRTLLVVER